MPITRLDHLVLTVGDFGRTIAFYTSVLGMGEVTFGGSRKALSFGEQKINLHPAGLELEPKAARPTPGSADLCFVWEGSLDEFIPRLAQAGVAVELGPVPRTGALGPITSVYFRDPDQNLIEVSVYHSPS